MHGTTSVLGYLKLAAVIVGVVIGSKQRNIPRSVRRFCPATRGHQAIETLTLGPRHSAPIENTIIADKKVCLAGRRDFLRFCTTGSGALVSVLQRPMIADVELNSTASVAAEPKSQTILGNGWIVIEPGNQIVLRVASSEMGQGVSTTMAALIAQELEAGAQRTWRGARV